MRLFFEKSIVSKRISGFSPYVIGLVDVLFCPRHFCRQAKHLPEEREDFLALALEERHSVGQNGVKRAREYWGFF